jgi:hypothetical protein
MATTTFICPECQAQLQGPANLRGKKARCRKCGKTIVLRAAGAAPDKADKPGSAEKKPAGKAAPGKKPSDSDGGSQMYAWLSEDDNQKLIEAARTTPIKSDLQPKYEDVSKNPYGLTKLDETPRCPFCAKEMEEGAIVCLDCGYNTQSRSHGKIVRTYATTPSEQFMWSLPGILCVAAMAALAFGIVYLWTGLPDPTSEQSRESVWKEFIRPAQVWGSIIAGFLIAGFGLFAFKRLIKNPRPPEKEKK